MPLLLLARMRAVSTTYSLCCPAARQLNLLPAIAGLCIANSSQLHDPAGDSHSGEDAIDSQRQINRKALPVPDDLLSHRTQTYVAPGNSMEKTAADMWIKPLKLEKVGIHDDFFESGEHCLLATRLVSHIRRAFGLEISLRSVFEAPTIAAMMSGLI